MPESAEISCMFGLSMTDKTDPAVQEAIKLVKTSSVAHRVFVSTFLNHEAIEAIVGAYETSAAQLETSDQKLTFISIYFGSSQANPNNNGNSDNSPYIKRQVKQSPIPSMT